MANRLKDKVALITGGASGFGKKTAEVFNAEAAVVYISDINEEGGKKVAEELGVNFVSHDVTKTEDWEKVIDHIKVNESKLNILVNNAGIGFMADVEATTIEEWDLVHKVDLDSVFYGCKYAIPLMRDSGNGSIVNVSSISGIVAGHNFAAYNSAKAAVRHLTKSVALHCARSTDLVRCNSVHPVFAQTEMMKAFFENPNEELVSKIERQIPVRKLVTVEDVANSILFLASDESNMITGSELIIDGGLSAM